MAYYLVQGSYSNESWKALVDNPVDREMEIRAAAEAYGAELHNLFFAFGERDVVALIIPGHHPVVVYETFIAWQLSANPRGTIHIASMNGSDRGDQERGIIMDRVGGMKTVWVFLRDHVRCHLRFTESRMFDQRCQETYVV